MIYRSILYLTISSFVVLLTCDTTKVSAQTSTIIKKEHLIGGDRDKHGCISSAGYTWSNVKNQCVRLFEVGIKLNPVTHNQEYFSAFIIFNEDQSQVELRLPNIPPTLLNRKGSKENPFWTNKSFKLFPTKEKNGYFLKDGDKTVYSTSEEKSRTTE